jgi:hypothetical protein
VNSRTCSGGMQLSCHPHERLVNSCTCTGGIDSESNPRPVKAPALIDVGIVRSTKR